MASSDRNGPSASVLCVVQARMGSTRLPGKVLMDLAGRPMLTLLLARLGPAGWPVLVATSDEDRDDPVAEVAERAGAAVVRGSETDVLDRYVTALDRFIADHVVRITADCPLTDATIVRDVVERHLDADADYTSNVLPRTFPQGLDVEVARVSSLRQAAAEAVLPVEREHVMPFLYRRPERFRLANVASGGNFGRWRWTVDTAEDLEQVRRLVARLDRSVDLAEVQWTDLAAVAEPDSDPTGVTLRPAFAADEELLLRLRNDADSVRFSRTRAGVDRVDHEAWFRSALEDPGRELDVVCLDGRPVGTMRTDVRSAVGTVSVVLDRRARGRGVAGRALELIQRRVAGGVRLDRLRAHVDPANLMSVALFERAGFVKVATTDGFDDMEWSPTVT